MSERYAKLFSLSENLYAETSPVIIVAGALLKDNQTEKVLAQLKIQNIAPKKIKALTVCIQPLDTVGNPLGDTVTYQYLDLSAGRDSEFGQKTPIALPNVAIRSFSVSVTEVIFADNTTWIEEIHPWESLKKPQLLSSLRDSELEKQFRLDYGFNNTNLLLEQKDLWHCICGAVNRQGETNCHKCRKSHADLKAIDMDSLRARKAERVAKEQEHSRAMQAQRAVEATRKRKIAIISLTVAVILIIAIVAVTTISSNAKKSDAYDHAMMLLSDECYEEAIQILEELGDYKDSSQQIEVAKTMLVNEENYNKALQALENGQDELAYQLFQKLGTYKDVADYLNNFSTYSVLTYVKRSGYGGVSEEKYEYDSNGNLISCKHYSDSECTSTVSYQYNADNLLIREDTYYTSGNHWWVIYEYDIYGNETARITYRSDYDGIYYAYYYEYDTSGQVVREVEDLGSGDPTIYTYNYTYDKEGRVVKDSWVNSYQQTASSEYTYNAEGLLSQERVVYYDGKVGITEYQYDDNDRLIFSSYKYDGEIRTDHSYEYDNDGNVLNEVINNYYSGSTTYIYNTYNDIIVYNPDK